MVCCKARNCWTRFSIRNCKGPIRAASSVSGLACWTASKRCWMRSSERLLCGTQHADFSLLELGQIGPAAQKIQRHGRAQILEQFQRHRIVAFEGGTQSVAKVGAIRYKPTAGFDQ